MSPWSLLLARRWVLDSIDGETFILDNSDDLVPDLDFGEQNRLRDWVK